MVAFLSLSCVGVKIIDFVLTKGLHDRLIANIYSCHLGSFQSERKKANEPHPDYRLRLLFRPFTEQNSVAPNSQRTANRKQTAVKTNCK